MTGLVLVVVLITKFLHGAWLAIARHGRALRAHARHPAGTTTGAPRSSPLDEDDDADAARAGCTRSSWSPRCTSRRCGPWPTPGRPGPTPRGHHRRRRRRGDRGAAATTGTRRDIPVPLKVLDSPYREITRPVIDYVRSCARGSPRDVVIVYIPEYVVGHWWEHLLHNQSALRLKARLLFTPGRHGHQRAVAAAVVRGSRRTTDSTGAVRAGVRTRRRQSSRRADATRSASPRRHRGRSSRSGRSPTAATASPGTRAASSSSGTRCRGSGCGSSSPRARRQPLPAGRRRRGARGVAGPGRAALPVCAARAAAAAATCSTLACAAQRALKAAVVARAAPAAGGARRRRRGVEHGAPGALRATLGLRWRTRVEFAVDDDGRAGLRQHRSHAIVPLDDCLIADQRVIDSGRARHRRWTGGIGVDAVAADEPADAVLVALPDGRVPTVVQRVDTRPSWSAASSGSRAARVLAGPSRRRRDLRSRTSSSSLGPRAGRAVLDLYAGAGLFAARSRRRGRRDRVGARRRVDDRAAVADARAQPGTTCRRRRVARTARVDRVLRSSVAAADPARTWSCSTRRAPAPASDVVRGSSPRSARVGSPTSRATPPRWRATLHTWRSSGATVLETLRAFDAFPMTHHVECIAVFGPADT